MLNGKVNTLIPEGLIPTSAFQANIARPIAGYAHASSVLYHIYRKMGFMKTTVEIPDAPFRKTKATAAERGVPLKELFTDAVREHLKRSAGDSPTNKPSAPAWISAFGGLRSLHKETLRIDRILQRESQHIDDDEWR